MVGMTKTSITTLNMKRKFDVPALTANDKSIAPSPIDENKKKEKVIK
jgi:hypothetical protein